MEADAPEQRRTRRALTGDDDAPAPEDDDAAPIAASALAPPTRLFCSAAFRAPVPAAPTSLSDRRSCDAPMPHPCSKSKLAQADACLKPPAQERDTREKSGLNDDGANAAGCDDNWRADESDGDREGSEGDNVGAGSNADGGGDVVTPRVLGNANWVEEG